MDEQERLFEILGTEPEVLVVTADPLRVEIDVEQLVGPQRLGDAVDEAESGHRLVRHLRVDTDHLWVIERRDEVQRVADRG